MSKNHNNYNRFNNAMNPPVEAKAEVPAVEETVTEVPEVETKVGTVTGCDRLNVRMEPSKKADVICIIKAGDTVVLAENIPFNGFYKVYTETGATGYCMKEFIDIK